MIELVLMRTLGERGGTSEGVSGRSRNADGQLAVVLPAAPQSRFFPDPVGLFHRRGSVQHAAAAAALRLLSAEALELVPSESDYENGQ